MEMDALDTRANCFSQLSFAAMAEALNIGNGTKLMELSKKLVKVNNSPWVLDPTRPIARLRKGGVRGRKIVDNFWVIPREC